MPTKKYEPHFKVVKNTVDSKEKNRSAEENYYTENQFRKKILDAINQAGSVLADIVEQAIPERIPIGQGKIVFRDKGKIILINEDEVTHCKGRGDCTEYHFRNHSPLVKCGSIGRTISQLIDPIFVVTHKSWIVNLNEIYSFEKSKRELNLNDGTIVPVSKSKLAFFKELWN